MSKCIIIILNENDSGTFYAGQTLEGYVKLNLPKSKKCRGLRLKIEGVACFSWREYELTTTKIYRDLEPYLNKERYLFGCKNGESKKIEAGVHIYHFSCLLPPDLPSSFESFYGSICYQIEANLDIRWGIDKNMVTIFKVGRLDNLNLYPNLKMPCEAKIMKTFCCLFFASKPLSLEASIPYSGYTPGETINVAIKVINYSNKTVPKCQIGLRQKIKYIFRGEKKIDYKYLNEVMVEVETQGVERRTTASFNKQLVIPSNLTNTNVLFCKILQVTYEIIVTCKTKGCSFSPRVYIPITLGSIPLDFDQ